MRILAQLLIIKQNWLTTIIEEKDTILLSKCSGNLFEEPMPSNHLIESQTFSSSVTSSTMETLRLHSIMLRNSLGMLHRMKRRTMVKRARELRVLLDRSLKK